jgi:hypothetical protein
LENGCAAQSLLLRRPKAISKQEGASSVVLPVCAGASLEHLPLGLNHPSEKKRLKIKDLKHVLIGKVDQLFRNML